MDNKSDSFITFDDKGNCNYCNDVLGRISSQYFPNEEGKKKLESLIDKMKAECKNEKYDCMVGLSGGIDSSYILMLGHRYGLRMLAVHIDDGLDNPVATENIRKLVEATKTDLINIKPNKDEYADILKSLFKASVRGLALGQDNLILGAIDQYGRINNIKYILDGNNIAQESILEKNNKSVNACDGYFLKNIQKQFGDVTLKETKFISLFDRYIRRSFSRKVKHVRPLNYIDYNFERALKELHDFCGFEYYGGKHYESILCRFLQCYYLPSKFGVDKRKSHLSSLIVSGQMTREEALEKLKAPLYSSEELLVQDKLFLAEFMGISMDELDGYINLPPHYETDYKHSKLNDLAPLARKFRKVIE
jgi:hypothetical protein